MLNDSTYDPELRMILLLILGLVIVFIMLWLASKSNRVLYAYLAGYLSSVAVALLLIFGGYGWIPWMIGLMLILATTTSVAVFVARYGIAMMKQQRETQQNAICLHEENQNSEGSLRDPDYSGDILWVD